MMHRTFFRLSAFLPRILVGLATLVAARTAVGFTLNTYDAAVWPRRDLVIGTAAFVVEDFEDAQLAPGLKIEIAGIVEPTAPPRRCRSSSNR
jgi:hypothetical protein